MKIRVIIALFAIWGLCAGTTCVPKECRSRDSHWTLYIDNRSGDTVNVLNAPGYINGLDSVNLNGLSQEHVDSILKYNTRTVAAGTTDSISYHYSFCLEYLFKEFDTLHVLFLSPEVDIDNLTQVMQAEEHHLKLAPLTWEQLVADSFTVIYP